MTVPKMFGLAMQSMAEGEVNFIEASKLGCLLMTSTAALNADNTAQDTYRYVDDLPAGELDSGAGDTNYVRKSMTGTIGYTAGTNICKLSCSNITWTALTTATNARFAVFYHIVTTDANSPLLCYMDFEVSQELIAQDFTLVVPGAGLIPMTAIT